MKWRGNDLKPGDYGNQDSEIQLIGGGSTVLTKYYQTYVGKYGDDVKEAVEELPFASTYWKDITYVPPGAGDIQSYGLMHPEHGHARDERANRVIYPARLQLSMRVEWQGKTTSELGVYPGKKMELNELFVCIYRDRRDNDKQQTNAPLFDQAWYTKMPQATWTVRAEIVAWGLVKPDPEKLHRFDYEVTAEPLPVTTVQRLEAHETMINFDIQLEGTLKYGTFEIAAAPLKDGLRMACWWTKDTTTHPKEPTTVRSRFTWSETPPKRMWRGVRPRWQDDGFDDPYMLEDEGMEPDGILMLAEANEGMAMESAGKRARN